MDTRDFLSEINNFEAHYQYDTTYMRELLEHSPEGYKKFSDFLPLVRYRKVLPSDAYWVAKLAAMLVEDCGDCLQLNVRMALEDDVPKKVIKSVLNGGDQLGEKLGDLYVFSTGVAAHAQIEGELEERINGFFGKEALLELSLCIATAKVFPTIKRALGYTRSCCLVEIKV